MGDVDGPGASLIVIIEWMVLPCVALLVYYCSEAALQNLRLRKWLRRIVAWMITLALWEAIMLTERFFGQFASSTIVETLVTGLVSLSILTFFNYCQNLGEKVESDEPLCLP